MTKHRVYSISFARIYPLYIEKAEKKGRTQAEVDEIILWLTGYSRDELHSQMEKQTDLETFFCRISPIESITQIDYRCYLRCPRRRNQRANHAGNPIPGQTHRRTCPRQSHGKNPPPIIILLLLVFYLKFIT